MAAKSRFREVRVEYRDLGIPRDATLIDDVVHDPTRRSFVTPRLSSTGLAKTAVAAHAAGAAPIMAEPSAGYFHLGPLHQGRVGAVLWMGNVEDADFRLLQFVGPLCHQS